MGKASLGNRYEMDMTSGPLFSKIMLFSIPLIASGMLQLLFNVADIIVVGRFAGETSLAAVGSVGAIANLIIHMFLGLSVGTNVLTAHAIGSKDGKLASDTVHTSVVISLLFGVILALIGIPLARPLLLLMDTPADVIDKATIYLQVCFLGMPASMLYNFVYAVMRALGDTKRPMYYLIFAGIINVILNIIFVTQFNMDVAGVALATCIAQGISALLIIRALSKLDNECKFEFKKLRINSKVLSRMIRIGLPAGIQSTLFSFSNVLIQSSINSFGSTAIAGNAAAANIEGFVYGAMNAFHQTALSFTSQNYGAGKLDRIKKVNIQCIFSVIAVGALTGAFALIFAENLLPLFSKGEGVIKYGIIRMQYICTTYFLCGVMEALTGSIRGLGSAVVPTIITLIWVCAFRILWVFTAFEYFRTLDSLYISYPVSWIITIICLSVYFAWLYKKKAEHLIQT